MTIVFSKYDPNLTYAGQKKFDCGNAAINKFAHDSLKSQVRKGVCVAYVLLPKQIPCTRLIMLGVDSQYKGRNLGKQLMKEAFKATKLAAQAVGSFGMYLDAYAEAVGFYEALGFSLLEGNKSPDPSPMFLPMSGVP